MADRIRWAVYNALLEANWHRIPDLRYGFHKGDAVVVLFDNGEVGLDGARNEHRAAYTISFPEETPDALILAACREAVKGARGRIGSGQTVAYKQASGSSEAGEPRD